jgi:hypothetical protein
MAQKKHGELGLAAFFVVLGVMLVISAGNFPERAQTSTAVYVRFVGLGMAILAGADFLLTLRKEGAVIELFANKVYFFGLVGLMIAYMVLLMLDVGFLVSTLPFLIGASILLGYRKWRTMAITFVTTLLATYFIFFRLLEVPMP